MLKDETKSAAPKGVEHKTAWRQSVATVPRVAASLPDGQSDSSPTEIPTEIKGVSTLNFGCRLNTLETEVMRRRAEEAGVKDALLINSCAVTGEAVRQVKQSIRKAHREDPNRPIVVSGCAVQVAPDDFADLPGVSTLLGNQEKLTTEAYKSLPSAGGAVERRFSDIMTAKRATALRVDGLKDRARAIVQVQNGCDHRCTFCIIPYGRGPSRSVPPSQVVDQVTELVDHGYQEVVLTGVDLTSYGTEDCELGSLGMLVQRILRDVPDLKRLRLSSIDSIEADTALYDVLANEDRLMPHLHLSLQAGDDLTLKRMKRRHLASDAEAFCAKARHLRPDIVFGADLIAGFPTETDDMFRSTLDHVDACGLTYLHVFPFSPREGTPAARMPQLNRDLIKSRAARLRAKGEMRHSAFLDNEVGHTRHILMERAGLGRTEHFATVKVPGAQAGQLITAQIQSVAGKDLVADLRDG